MFFRRRRSDQPSREVATSSPQKVLREEERYTREVLRLTGISLVTAILLFLSFALFAVLSSLDVSSTAPTMSVPQVGVDRAGAALIVLLPLAIALQVLMRMPRDPEMMHAAESAAHRQFWGHIAAVVAMASGFVGIGSFLHELMSFAASDQPLDFLRLAGVPLGAAASLLIAADAATLSNFDARRLNLRGARRAQQIAVRRVARMRILGTGREHPAGATAFQGIVATAATIVPLSLLVQNHFGKTNITAMFAAAAVILVAFAWYTFGQVLRSTVMLRMLDAIVTLGFVALVFLIYGMQVVAGVLTSLGTMNSVEEYIPVVALGLATPLPALVVIAVLTLPRGARRRTAPLLDMTRRRLGKEIERISTSKDESERRRTWTPFAWTAIVLCLLPLAALPAAVIAQSLRRGDQEADKRGLMVTAWAAPLLALMSEIAAVMLLPMVGEALGWFTLT